MRSDWDRYAETDPLWAILTNPGTKGRRWDPDAFFETGRQEIEALMQYVRSLPADCGRGRALDFGCGVGRLTRALADHFEEVYGVDISPAMIKLARQYSGHIPKCKFAQNPDPSFRALPAGEFDLIYSNITLQHIPPRHSKRYLQGMMRLLRPGGVLIFQLPSHSWRALTGKLWHLWYEEVYRRCVPGADPLMAMYGVRKGRMIELIEAGGCRLLDVQANGVAGPKWTSYRYAVKRPSG